MNILLHFLFFILGGCFGVAIMAIMVASSKELHQEFNQMKVFDDDEMS